VFDLINEFIIGYTARVAFSRSPWLLRPGRINTADDLNYWLNLLSEEIERQVRQKKKFPM